MPWSENILALQILTSPCWRWMSFCTIWKSLVVAPVHPLLYFLYYFMYFCSCLVNLPLFLLALWSTFLQYLPVPFLNAGSCNFCCLFACWIFIHCWTKSRSTADCHTIGTIRSNLSYHLHFMMIVSIKNGRYLQLNCHQLSVSLFQPSTRCISEQLPIDLRALVIHQTSGRPCNSF